MIQDRFDAFNEAHPEVYDLFDRFTRELIARGFARHSARDVLHRIRWEAALSPTEEEYKINDHHSPYYARLWMKANPEHSKFFELRVTQQEAA